MKIPFLGPIFDIIDKIIPDADKKLELKKALSDNDVKIEEKFIEYAKQKHNLRLKELEHTGFKSWWRPGAMFALTVSMTLYLLLYYIIPQIIVIFNINVYYLEPIPMPEVIWHVYAGCMLGLGFFRSVYDKRK